MYEKYIILNISVKVCIKAIGKTQIFLIAITSEICFVSRDEVEVYEFTWHYSIRLLGTTQWRSLSKELGPS